MESSNPSSPGKAARGAVCPERSWGGRGQAPFHNQKPVLGDAEIRQLEQGMEETYGLLNFAEETPTTIWEKMVGVALDTGISTVEDMFPGEQYTSCPREQWIKCFALI